MKFTQFDEFRFRKQVDGALNSVRRILDTSRNPRLAHEYDKDHTYDDKFALAELLTGTAVVAQVNVLKQWGLQSTELEQMLRWVQDDHKAVTMRFEATQTCQFLKMTEVPVVNEGSKVELQVTEQHDEQVGSEQKKSTKTKTIQHQVTTVVQEYHWKIHMDHQLLIFAGATPEAGTSITLQKRDAWTILAIKGTERAPFQEVIKHKPVDVNLTWLLENVTVDSNNKNVCCRFAIYRSDPQKCKTPVWNEQIQQALHFFSKMESFAASLAGFWRNHVERGVLGRHAPVKASLPAPSESNTASKPKLNTIVAHNFTCPVLPLFENINNKEGESNNSSPLLSSEDVDKLLGEHARSMKESLDALRQKYVIVENNDGDNKEEDEQLCTGMRSPVEATHVFLSIHLVDLARQYKDSVGYIEDMLKKQLVAAIGKEVQRQDFDQFMSFHLKNKLFGKRYSPNPFCFAIRQPRHFPDGIITIEQRGDDGKIEPIETFTRKIPATEATPSIKIPLNAATTLQMTGDRYLHGWIRHSFASPHTQPDPQLAVRARQFSCFLVMVGTMAGPDQFNPKDAIIVQNKDEVLIPLLLNALPSAKEFKDAISSMSPEQQSFAKSFRGMQLESSVFGVCVVQLKPQLEDLLVLPGGSLTKEMQLTQDLLSLFIDYQIPPDLLSYDGDEDATKATKVGLVKEYAKSIMDVVQNEKEKQLQLERERAERAELVAKRLAELEQHKQGRAELKECYQMRCVSKEQRSRDTQCKETGRNQIKENTNFDMARSLFGGGCDDEEDEEEDISVASYAKIGPGPRTGPMTDEDRKANAMTDALNWLRGSEVGADGLDDPDALAKMLAASGEGLGGPLSPADQKAHHMVNALDWRRKSNAAGGDLDDVDDVSADSHIDDGGSDGENQTPTKSNTVEIVDFTKIPQTMDAMFDVHDTDGSLRATKIKTADVWTRKRYESLLSKTAQTTRLSATDIRTEKDKAFDLLDALSRSGTLSLKYSELHVIVAVTHCFDNDVMGTVLQDNINPIIKVEKSSLMVASTIHGGVPPMAMVKSADQALRLQSSFPALFGREAGLS